MRWITGAVLCGLVFILGAVQLASDGFAASAAAAGTLPTRIPRAFSLKVYHVLDRIAPAPYVEESLAQDALAHGDADAAEAHAVRLPASPVRDELLARVALTRNEPALALEYFLAAPDAEAVQREVEARASLDPSAGYALERVLDTRLLLLSTHPDALADAYWRTGLLANRTAWIQVPGSPRQFAWLRRALDAFETEIGRASCRERVCLAV